MLKNASLAVKLNSLVLLVLAMLLVGVIFLLIQNTESLTQEIGGERIVEEVNIIQNRLEELKREMLVDTNFIISSVSFFQAVGRRSAADTAAIINTANASLGLDDITVVDGDGVRLVDIQVDADTASEDRLLQQALSDIPKTSLLIEQEGAQIAISLATSAPIKSVSGNILGAIQMSRHINTDFLKALIFQQEATYLGLAYGDTLIAYSDPEQASPGQDILVNDIALNIELVQAAQLGEAIIQERLVIGQGGVPHMVAYVPIMTDNIGTNAVIMVVVELDEIFSFQNRTLANTILVFFALTLVTMAIIYGNLYRTVIKPLNELRTSSQTITAGQYDKRVPVMTSDEVGQLAHSFNEMALAVQQREVSLRAAREQAERADQVKSMFLASVSHELRTPLNAIINLTKFVGLGMYGTVNSEQVDILQKVESRSKHLLNLINDVLDISKIESGSLELFVEDGLHIADIAQSAVETTQGLIINKPITICLEIEDDLPSITGDSQRIQQIIINLLSNACKFTDEGTICVRVYRQAHEVIILIKDPGVGIAPEDHSLIFESFRQTKDGLRKGEGTGLGLPISQRLAQAHGGRLWFESAIGEGATFYVALPLKSDLVATL